MSKFLVKKKKIKSQIKTTSLNNRKEINIKTPKYHRSRLQIVSLTCGLWDLCSTSELEEAIRIRHNLLRKKPVLHLINKEVFFLYFDTRPKTKLIIIIISFLSIFSTNKILLITPHIYIYIYI
jgi:hypothetical protein